MANLSARFRSTLLLIGLPFAALAQPGVGIGTIAPDASAALDIVSSTKGVLLPRVASATALASPAAGLLVYQTGAPTGFYYNAGTASSPSWQQLATASGAAITASNGLTKTGQDVALGGSLAGATTVALGGNNLNFSSTSGNVGLATADPQALLDIGGGADNSGSNSRSALGFGFRTGGYRHWIRSRHNSTLNTNDNALDFYLNSGATAPVSTAPGALSAGNPTGAGSGTVHALSLTHDGGSPRVGIGTADPQASLHVAGSTSTVRLDGLAGTGTRTMTVAPDGTLGTSGTGFIQNQTTLQPSSNFNISGTGLVGGMVGIGTTSPHAPLQFTTVAVPRKIVLFETVNNDHEFFGFGVDAFTLRYQVANGNDSHVFFRGNGAAASIELMRIAGTGNVGIGTSTPAAKLDLQGGADNNGSNDPVALAFGYRTGGYRHFLRSRHNATVSGDGNDLDFYLNNSGTSTGSTAPGTGNVQVLTLENNNSLPRVGIGTSAPTATLDVNGALRVRSLTAGLIASDASGNLTTGSASTFSSSFILNQTALQTSSNFNVSGDGLVGGMVGIGTTTPHAPLQFTSVAVPRKVVLYETVNNDHEFFGLGVDAFTLRYQVANTNDSHVFFRGNGSAASIELMRIAGNGNVGINKSVPTATLHVGGGASTVRLEGLAGTGTRVVTADATGNLGTVTTASLGDNLGNHTATQALNLGTNALTGTGASISGVGVGVRADGGLNLGQTTAGNNVLLGYQAGQAVTTGDRNVLLGYQAGQANTTGSNNHFSGYQAGFGNTTGDDGSFEGYQAGYSNTTGSNNFFDGYQAGYSNTTGHDNHFSGNTSGYTNTTGSDNLFSGSGSGYSNTTGSKNSFSGTVSGYSNTTGHDNVFSGDQAGTANTTGYNNLFSGTQSGFANTTGINNLFSGTQSGFANTTGNGNSFIGYQSGYNNISGGGNQFMGSESGRANTTGAHNVFSGSTSGYLNTTGTENVFVGGSTGYNNVDGDRNTALGPFSGPATGLGNLANTTSLGNEATVSTSNTIQFGNSSITTLRCQVGLTVASDARFKYDVQANVPGLRFITRLRPVTYRFDTDKLAAFLRTGELAPGFTEKDGAPVQTGLLAQEVEQAAKEAGFDFDGVHIPANARDYYGVAYSQLVVPLVQAVQELSKEVETLKARNAALTADHAALLTMQAQLAKLLGEGAQAQK